MRSIQEINLREILPPSIANDPDIQAAADSITEALRETTEYIHNLAIFSRLRRGDIEDSALVDEMAWAWSADFYDPSLPLDTRQKLVANALPWHMIKGTKRVIEEIVTAVFADAIVERWYEYGGLPYTFRITTEIPDVTEESLQQLILSIYSVKATRSDVEKIQILRPAESDLYLGTAVTQNIRTRHNIAVDVNIDQEPWYYAAFVVQRMPIIIAPDGLL